MKIAIVVIFLLMFTARVGMAADAARYELRDGSIIRAEIISLQDGHYTLQSETLGTIRIEKSRIRSITMGAAKPADKSVTTSSPTPDASAPAASARIENLSKAIMADPGMMDRLSSLSQDPDVMQVLRDPEIMKAVNAGDLASLMSNQKFMQMLNNSTIQDIVKQVSP